MVFFVLMEAAWSGGFDAGFVQFTIFVSSFVVSPISSTVLNTMTPTVIYFLFY